MLDVARTKKLVEQCWADEIIPTLVEYIKIPNKSPSFDPDWVAHGYMDEAAGLFERWAWAKLPSLTGATLKVARLPGRTPVIVIDVPGEGEDKVLLYGHLDTAGNGRMDRGLRPVDPASGRRQAQWPRRGR